MHTGQMQGEKRKKGNSAPFAKGTKYQACLHIFIKYSNTSQYYSTVCDASLTKRNKNVLNSDLFHDY